MMDGVRVESEPGWDSPQTLRANLMAALIVAAVSTVACLIGILTRPDNFWAVVWLAPAVLVGIYVRWPRVSNYGGWLGAVIGYIVASYFSPLSLAVDIWIAAISLVGVGLCVASLSLATNHWKLEGSRYVLAAVAAISASSILVSAIGSEAGAYLLDNHRIAGFNTWISLELSAMAMLVPPILSFPGVTLLNQQYRRAIGTLGLADAGIAAVLAATVALSWLVGGASAIAIPVPALILCALRFSFFSTCFITTIVTGACLSEVARTLIDSTASIDLAGELDSLRLGIAAVAIAPTVVVSFYGDRALLIQRLEHASTHDFLTAALTRSAFMSLGQDAFELMKATKKPLALVMVDIDHFKQVNDRFGHVIGDLVLVEFSRIAQATLREGSLFGRFGGEEFAVIMPDARLADAVATSMRLRAEVERAVLGVIGSEELQITLSVGLAYRDDLSNESLQAMLTAADNALYRAKTSGRNQVIISEDRFTDDIQLVGR
jgi:diguanylate cyclase (GGDEF)-like protein